MTLRNAFVCFLAAGLLGLACGGGTTPPVDDGVCQADAHCDTGLCRSGQCVSSCAEDCDCPAGLACSADAQTIRFCQAGPRNCATDVQCTTREEACRDGLDDDCDGLIDCDDVDCTNDAACASACVPTGEDDAASCGNGLDDDCDGDVDCKDADCLEAEVGSCFGDYAGRDCDSVDSNVYDLDEGQVDWRVTDLEVELTPTGLRTVALIASDAPSGTAEVELVMTQPQVGQVDVAAPPNEYLKTCKTCVTIKNNGALYFQRRGTYTLTEVPTQVGEVFSGSFAIEFDEVQLQDGEYELVGGGSCLRELGNFSGVAVAGGIVASGLSSLVLNEGGQYQGEEFGCGDGICKAAAGEDFDSCPADCACPHDNFSTQCEGGHLCPEGTECISRGRCTCGTRPWTTPVSCYDGQACDEASCEEAQWICLNEL